MRFRLQFHTPFRVATGSPSDGLNDTYDPANPLPASSLKGLMRSNAKLILGIEEPILNEVFGSRRGRSPWWWSDATLEGQKPSIRTRLSIDSDTGTARTGALLTGAELWADSGWFEIRDRDRIAPERRPLHLAVLAASARAITALGSDRRRGLGWVSVLPEDPWDDVQHELLRAHRGPDA